MVYESDFYTTRRPYRATPSISTYTVSNPTYFTVHEGQDHKRRSAEEMYSYAFEATTEKMESPRYYTVRDAPDTSRRAAEQQYSYSYQSTSERGGDPYSRPVTRSYTNTERVSRNTGNGPSGYSHTTERSSRSYGDGPGGYQSSYSSTTSGRLPGGTTYRHYSYRV